MAVYLCEDKSCSYPEGYDSVHVEQRSFDKLFNRNKEDIIQKSDLDKWLEEFFDNEEDKKDQSTELPDDDELSKIIDEITNETTGNDNVANDQDLFTWIDNALQDFSLDKTGENKTSEMEGVGNFENIKTAEQNSFAAELHADDSEKKTGEHVTADITSSQNVKVRRIKKRCTTTFLKPGWVFSPKRKQLVQCIAPAYNETDTSKTNKFANFKYVNIPLKPEEKFEI